MGKDLIKKVKSVGKKVKSVGKKVSKVSRVIKITKKSATAGMAVLENVAPEKADNIYDNMENIQNKIDNNTVGFRKFLEQLEKKYDEKVGNKINNQIVQIEQWIADHGGSAVENFLSQQNNPEMAIISPALLKTVSKTFNRVWKKKKKSDK